MGLLTPRAGPTPPTWTLSEGAANESAATLDSSSTLLPTHEDLPLSNAVRWILMGTYFETSEVEIT